MVLSALPPASTHLAPVVLAKGCKLLFFSWFTLHYDLHLPGADVETSNSSCGILCFKRNWHWCNKCVWYLLVPCESPSFFKWNHTIPGNCEVNTLKVLFCSASYRKIWENWRGENQNSVWQGANPCIPSGRWTNLHSMGCSALLK